MTPRPGSRDSDQLGAEGRPCRVFTEVSPDRGPVFTCGSGPLRTFDVMERPEDPAVHELPQLRAYPLEVVEQLLADVMAERDRLREAVADAHARLLAARGHLAVGAAPRERLGTMALDVQQAVLDRRGAAAAAVARIVEGAEREAESIIAAARAEAAAIRSYGTRSVEGSNGSAFPGVPMPVGREDV